ncbi:MAG: hypothetical protein PVF90_02700 [Gemmatimonadota bacterium]
MSRHVSGLGRAAARCVLLLVVTSGVGVAPALGQELRWTGTVSYSQGSYVFDQPTRTVSLYTGLGLTWGRFDLGASLPVLAQNSQLVSQVAGIPLPTGGPDSGVIGQRQPGETVGTRGRGQGGGGMTSVTDTTVVYSNELSMAIGDPFFTAGVGLYQGTGVIRSVQARGSTKAPLRGVDSGVGTGEWDFGAGASVFGALGDVYLFGDVSYWWYGDMPGLELVDGIGYGVGVSRSVMGARGSLMASFSGAHAAIPSMDAPASLGLGFSYMPSLGRSFSTGLTLGLSESSPDFSVYAGWSLTVG